MTRFVTLALAFLLVVYVVPVSARPRGRSRGVPLTTTAPIGPRLPADTKLPHAPPEPGIYALQAGAQTCARTLDMQFVGESPGVAKLWLNGAACAAGTLAHFRFKPVHVPSHEAGRLSAHAPLAAVWRLHFSDPLSCVSATLPRAATLVYVAPVPHASAVEFTKALLTLRRMGLDVNALSAAARRPGAYVQSSTGCVWRRVGALGSSLDDLDGPDASPDAEAAEFGLQSSEEGHNGGVNGDEDGAEKRSAEKNNCFPGSARVALPDGTTRAMAALRVGDAVHTSAASASRIVAWTHRVRGGRHAFVRVRTTDRDVVLTASHGHYVYIGGGALRAADALRVGDELELGHRDGSLAAPVRVAVTAVEHVVADGLYNPQTGDGDIVVDGVRCSTYTRAVPPVAAHALLAPVRAAMRVAWTWGAAVSSGGHGPPLWQRSDGGGL